jgi:hypothetical protein
MSPKTLCHRKPYFTENPISPKTLFHREPLALKPLCHRNSYVTEASRETTMRNLDFSNPNSTLRNWVCGQPNLAGIRMGTEARADIAAAHRSVSEVKNGHSVAFLDYLSVGSS